MCSIDWGDKLVTLCRTDCMHEWDKSLHNSGMYFTNVCNKCGETEPHVVFKMPEDMQERIQAAMIETMITGQSVVLISADEINGLKMESTE